MNAQQKWGPLSESVHPLETWQIAQAMSAQTRNGQVPDYEQARRYAMGETAQEPIANYADRRGV